MKALLPPVLVLIFAAAAILASALLPADRVVPEAWRPWGWALVAAGALLTAAARMQFARARTAINTFAEPGTLVTGGAFRLSRNPMYLGFAAVLAGLAVRLGSASAIALALLFVLIADRWYIAFEEARLRRRFGETYADYARRTRRWL
ncbi:MAG TPA: isoprenylcysteine carboxylmethyltransferase family protein [Azospirillaceae bacterium]|nr:isoprenylcysteine carboxylmethyltransferase family protein [Azospirillaceae bacterium]